MPDNNLTRLIALPSDYDPSRNIIAEGITTARPRHIRHPFPDAKTGCSSKHRIKCPLPRKNPKFHEPYEFLCCLPPARTRVHGFRRTPDDYHRYARNSWIASDTLWDDFGWTIKKIYKLQRILALEHDISILSLAWPDYRDGVTVFTAYFAIADHHWEIASIIASEYWSLLYDHQPDNAE